MLLKNAMKTPIPDVWLRTRELGWPDEISIVLLRHRAYVRAALTKGHCKTDAVTAALGQLPSQGTSFHSRQHLLPFVPYTGPRKKFSIYT